LEYELNSLHKDNNNNKNAEIITQLNDFERCWRQYIIKKEDKNDTNHVIEIANIVKMITLIQKKKSRKKDFSNITDIHQKRMAIKTK